MTRYLAIGPHPDDVEVGCGATLFSLLQPEDELYYVIMSMCLDIPRNTNIEQEWDKTIAFLKENLRCKVTAEALNFTNRRMLEEHMEIRATLEKIKREFSPDVVITSSPKDIHQDHKYIGEEVTRVFRESSIITYEIPRSVGKFTPNIYVAVNQSDVDKAIKMISFYESQAGQNYMKLDLIEGTLKHRGGEVGRKYAQAFESNRLIIENKDGIRKLG